MHCPLKTPLHATRAELAAGKGALAQRQCQHIVARSSNGDADGNDDDNTPSSSRRSLLLASTASLGAAAAAATTTNIAFTANAAASPPSLPLQPFPVSGKPAAPPSSAPPPFSAVSKLAAASNSPAALEVARARVAVLRAVSSASSQCSPATPESLRDRNLAGYEAMAALHARDAALFHALLASDRAAFLPLVYTPAVADACANWGTLLTRPPGLRLSADDAACAGGKGLRAVVDDWVIDDGGGGTGKGTRSGKATAPPPLLPPRLAVVSDGARILALGDLAAHGMGIPVGKCFLHSAGGGLAPSRCLPVIVDAGRGSGGENSSGERSYDDPFYLGRRAPRLRGAAYAAFLAEALQALRGRFGPKFIIHLEDFAGGDAAALLASEEAAGLPCFDDDIQATGAAAVAAVLAATGAVGGGGGRPAGDSGGLAGVPALGDQVFLFFGAGQAAVGVARCAVAALSAPEAEGGAGLSEREAKERMFLVDSKGLVVAAEDERAAATEGQRALKAEFARAADDPVVLKLRGGKGGKSSNGKSSLAEIVAAVRPTALIGAAGVAGAFDAEVLRALVAPSSSPSPSSSSSPLFRPLVFALSNPTAFSECTPEQAAEATGGRAVFAGGSPFPDWEEKRGGGPARKGARRRAAQANNALVFPGVALGLAAADASGLGGGASERALLPAARALAALVTAADLAEDAPLPRVGRLPEATRAVAAATALAAVAAGSAGPRCLPALRAAAAAAGRARDDGDAAAEARAVREAEEAIREIQFDGEAAFAASFS